jgi:hypothetical protein
MTHTSEIKKFTLVALLLVISMTISCDKEHEYGFKPNAVQTLEVLNFNQTGATVSGNIYLNQLSQIIKKQILPIYLEPTNVFLTIYYPELPIMQEHMPEMVQALPMEINYLLQQAPQHFQ